LRYVILLFIIICNLLLSAEIIWEVDYGCFGGDYANIRPTVALFDDESFAVVARIFYTDPWGQQDSWAILAKYDSEGGLQWYVEDYYDCHLVGVIEIDGGCTITARNYISSHYGIIKRDSSGEILWEIDIPDIFVNNIIKVDNTSFILIGKINYDDNNAVIIKMNTEGNILWWRYFDMGGSSSLFSYGIITSDNSIAMIGRLASYESFVLKVSAEGDSLWSHFNQDGSNKWIFEDSENNIIVLSSSETIKYDLLGNVIQTSTGDFDYGIDITPNNFLARNDEFGSPFIFDIFQFDYNLNYNWLTHDYFRYYFIQIPDNGFLFINEYDFHFIRTNEEFVSINENSLTISENQISNYPNPFNPSTTIEFLIQQDSKVDLSIFNVKGQKIKTLARNEFPKGSHSIKWNGVDEANNPLSSGIYYYKLNVNGKTETVKKCLLLK